MQYIRKVSIGSDYKSSMNYVVGQKVLSTYIIHSISRSPEPQKGYVVYIENDKQEIIPWKFFNESMPLVLEYNINY